MLCQEIIQLVHSRIDTLVHGLTVFCFPSASGPPLPQTGRCAHRWNGADDRASLPSSGPCQVFHGSNHSRRTHVHRNQAGKGYGHNLTQFRWLWQSLPLSLRKYGFQTPTPHQTVPISHSESRSTSSSSWRNCVKYRCGARGRYPIIIRIRQAFLADCVFASISVFRDSSLSEIGLYVEHT